MDPLRSRLVNLEESVPVSRTFDGARAHISSAAGRRMGLLLVAALALVPVLAIGLVFAGLSGSGSASGPLVRVDVGAYAVYYDGNRPTSAPEISGPRRRPAPCPPFSGSRTIRRLIRSGHRDFCMACLVSSPRAAI